MRDRDRAVGTGWRWPGPERVRNHPGPEMIKDGGSHYACLRTSQPGVALARPNSSSIRGRVPWTRTRLAQRDVGGGVAQRVARSGAPPPRSAPPAAVPPGRSAAPAWRGRAPSSPRPPAAPSPRRGRSTGSSATPAAAPPRCRRDERHLALATHTGPTARRAAPLQVADRRVAGHVQHVRSSRSRSHAERRRAGRIRRRRRSSRGARWRSDPEQVSGDPPLLLERDPLRDMRRLPPGRVSRPSPRAGTAADPPGRSRRGRHRPGRRRPGSSRPCPAGRTTGGPRHRRRSPSWRSRWGR